MRMILAGSLALGLAVATSGCGSPPDSPPAGEATADAAAAPSAATSADAAPSAAATVADGAPAAFNQCKVCHSAEKGKMGVGPSLFGVYGTKSGEIAGYAFSDAMKSANLTWDDATLDEYLTAPMKKVPGTKMTFAGLTDAAQRKAVIDYLKTLK